MNITLTNLLKNTIAEFVCYRDGDLWYRISTPNSCEPASSKECIFEFPVPISDTGTGIFDAKVKSITLMRWVRKHFEKIQKGEWK
jgi:hypothetical protein